PHPDVILVPGGPGEAAVRTDAEVLAWLRAAHETSRWTTSVCTGALTLAAAGFLDGIEATTHWSSMDDLAALGAKPVEERVVIRGKVITAAGVSAGIDMALRLAQLEAGDDIAMAIQLILEYDPQPPFDAGSPAKAPAHVLAMVQERRRSG
ncbi:MAG TPA: DJ-1/PfpI family protein, partial [Acidimicrobiales bacterium]|nr:DJ-1/PfpI family protein [Acidimicrobiales bacterium]